MKNSCVGVLVARTKFRGRNWSFDCEISRCNRRLASCISVVPVRNRELLAFQMCLEHFISSLCIFVLVHNADEDAQKSCVKLHGQVVRILAQVGEPLPCHLY